MSFVDKSFLGELRKTYRALSEELAVTRPRSRRANILRREIEQLRGKAKLAKQINEAMEASV